MNPESKQETIDVIVQLETLRDEIEAGNYEIALAWLEAAIRLLKKQL